MYLFWLLVYVSFLKLLEKIQKRPSIYAYL